MTEVFLILAFIAFILLTTAVICIAKEIDELKEKLEQHRIRLNYLAFDYLSISDIEYRLDKLEELIELKEYFDKESLNKQIKRDYN